MSNSEGNSTCSGSERDTQTVRIFLLLLQTNERNLLMGFVFQSVLVQGSSCRLVKLQPFTWEEKENSRKQQCRAMMSG